MKGAFLHILLTLTLFTAVTAKSQHNADSIDARRRAIEYYLMEATSLQEQGRFDESFEVIEYCRTLDPESAAIQDFAVPYYIMLDKDSIAQNMLEYIVKAYPDNEIYSGALVHYYYNKGDWQAAIALYEKLLETAESKEEIYMVLHNMYYENGAYEKALATLDKIIKFVGNTTDISVQKLKLFLHLGRNEEAVELGKQLIEENPGDSRFICLLGGTYNIIGETALAESLYMQVLNETPDDVTALSSLADIYAQNDEHEKYYGIIERLVKNEKFETNERLRYIAGYLLHLEQTDSIKAKTFMREIAELPFDQLAHNELYVEFLEYKKADAEEILPVLERIVELDPENINAIIKQLSYAIDREDAEAVLRYADEALLYLPHRLELYYYKGFSHYMLGEKAKSIETFEQGIKVCDKDTEPSTIATVYATIGNTYNELEKDDECYAAYDSALVYDPYNLEVLNNYSYFLSLDEEDLQRALDMSKKTVEAEPENDTFLDTYAWILFKMERYEEAKAYAEKIISLGVELSPVVLHHIGDIYAKCGDTEKAVLYWQKARDAGDETKILEKKIRKRRYYRGAKY